MFLRPNARERGFSNMPRPCWAPMKNNRRPKPMPSQHPGKLQGRHSNSVCHLGGHHVALVECRKIDQGDFHFGLATFAP